MTIPFRELRRLVARLDEVDPERTSAELGRMLNVDERRVAQARRLKGSRQAPVPLTQSMYDEIEALAEEGWSYSEIGEQYGQPRGRISAYLCRQRQRRAEAFRRSRARLMSLPFRRWGELLEQPQGHDS